MWRFIAIVFSLLFLGGLGAAGGAVYVFYEFGRGLPDVRQLADYEPPIMTRIYAGDGSLVTEYAVESRVFVPINAIPKRVIHAFLAAEDKNFYQHPGLDYQGIARAILVNIKNYGSGRRPVGASTITQQVAKNFLLTNEVSYERKIKEAILALRIERAFTKEHILELYLNEIYLGFKSYGVAAAAMNYFNKSLDELTLGEAAFLAALPKAPNNYNPITKTEDATDRRNWVLQRMHEDGYIDYDQRMTARGERIIVRQRAETVFVEGAGHFVEEIRRDLVGRFGEDSLYKGGLQVRTSLSPKLQEVAGRVLREGLIAYDRRHGWRGPIGMVEPGVDWPGRLAEIEHPKGLPMDWELALVLGVDDKTANVGFSNGSQGYVGFGEMKWARPWMEDQKVGPSPRSPKDVLKVGDVVAVEALKFDADGNPIPPGSYSLRQIPNIEGSLVALDPHTGRVLAMVGGFSFERSEFNRATQAKRQPGSAFKPFVYLAALDNGYTPSTLILDAPFVIDQGPGLPKWKPQNYGNRFYGPSTLRMGVEKSRNLMTVRLAQAVGMDKIATYARRFNVVDNLQETLAMSLGAGETTLLRLTTGYAMLVNGGKWIEPSLIDRVQDRTGKTVYKFDDRVCKTCRASSWTDQPVPQVPDNREQLTDPASAYQIVSILNGVVQRGTGRRVAAVGKPLGGKTGTTNDSTDTWFVGFSPDLAVGVFVGFDEPRTLGNRETGSSAAAPIFRDFMMEALSDKPATPFRIPPGIRLVRVNHKTGLVARAGDSNVILEAFKPDDSVPTTTAQVVGGGEIFQDPAETEGMGGGGTTALPSAGGLY